MNLESYEKALMELGRGLKVLYVEDEPIIREQVQEFISLYFGSIKTAENGLMGLEMWRAGEYDLIISDIKMPKMTGIEMSETIKKENPDQPILITSAHSDSDYLLRLIDVGVDNYILKPLDDVKFIHALYRVAKSIVDAKMVEAFQNQLLEANAQLEEKNRELGRKNSELEAAIARLTKTENRNIALAAAIENHRLIDSKELLQLRKRYKKMSAQEFEQTYPLDLSEKVAKLQALEEDFQVLVTKINSNSGAVELSKLGEQFKQFSQILYRIGEFHNIGYALENLGQNISKMEAGANFTQVQSYVAGIVANLGRWIESNFIEKNAVDIHFIDDSLISDCVFVETLIRGEALDEGSEIEESLLFF